MAAGARSWHRGWEGLGNKQFFYCSPAEAQWLPGDVDGLCWAKPQAQMDQGGNLVLLQTARGSVSSYPGVRRCPLPRLQI